MTKLWHCNKTSITSNCKDPKRRYIKLGTVQLVYYLTQICPQLSLVASLTSASSPKASASPSFTSSWPRFLKDQKWFILPAGQEVTCQSQSSQVQWVRRKAPGSLLALPCAQSPVQQVTLQWQWYIDITMAMVGMKGKEQWRPIKTSQIKWLSIRPIRWQFPRWPSTEGESQLMTIKKLSMYVFRTTPAQI